MSDVSILLKISLSMRDRLETSDNENPNHLKHLKHSNDVTASIWFQMKDEFSPDSCTTKTII